MNVKQPFAFGSLDDRANAEPDTDPADRISLRDHVVDVEIGAFQVERGAVQRVSFDVVVEVAAPATPLDDDVDRILSYEMLVEAIALELVAERMNLLETLAGRIAARILRAPQATRVFLRIQKLDRGPGALGVEIVRSRTGSKALSKTPTNDFLPHPLVVYLSNDAIFSEHLPNRLGQFQQSQQPVIICVGMPETRHPTAANPLVQRRIDLLAIEQNAWRLAGRDPRCLVVETKTEFEWAARNHRLSVWAPSKIVLDAVDGPATAPSDAVALAAWFAGEMQAQRLIIVDAATPVKTGLPVTALALDQNFI